MNSIGVGILAGRGFNDEAAQVYGRCVKDPVVDHLFVLMGAITPFMARNSKQFKLTSPVGGKTSQETFGPAANNRRGLARDRILKHLSSVGFDVMVILDDDTVPDPGYFEFLKSADFGEEALVMTGKLFNHDGGRCWDICTFDILGNPIVVPYEDWQNPLFLNGLYASGPQHIITRGALRLAPSYPDLTYGEDTRFCHNLKAKGGKVRFIPEISARLTHQHKEPNFYQGAWGSRDF